MTPGCWDSVPIPFPPLLDPWRRSPAGDPDSHVPGRQQMGCVATPWAGQGHRGLEAGMECPPMALEHGAAPPRIPPRDPGLVVGMEQSSSGIPWPPRAL